MSATTRSQLLDLIRDLQARPPAFVQQPAMAVPATPSRNGPWGPSPAGASLPSLVLAFSASLFCGPAVQAHRRPLQLRRGRRPGFGKHRDVPSPGRCGGHGLRRLPRPNRPRARTCRLSRRSGGRVGEFEQCSISDNGKRYNADVTATAVNGNRITTHEAVNEEVPVAAAEPT